MKNQRAVAPAHSQQSAPKDEDYVQARLGQSVGEILRMCIGISVEHTWLEGGYMRISNMQEE